MSTFICVKPKNVKSPVSVLRECIRVGGNGIGLCYSSEQQLFIKKGYKSLESLCKELDKLEDKSCIIAFSNRIENENHYIQPFKLEDNYVAAYHNSASDNFFCIKNESGAYNFHLLLKSFWNSNFFNQEYFSSLVGKAMGRNAAMVVMNNLGEYNIYNKFSGTNLYNCWFSESPYEHHYNPSHSHIHYPYNNKNTTNTTHACCKCGVYYTLNSLKVNTKKYYCAVCFDKIRNGGNTIYHSFGDIQTDNHKNYQQNNFLKPIINPDLINILDIF